MPKFEERLETIYASDRIVWRKWLEKNHNVARLSIQSAFDSPKPTTQTGGIKATAISLTAWLRYAVPAKLEEIFGSTLAKPAIRIPRGAITLLLRSQFPARLDSAGISILLCYQIEELLPSRRVGSG